MIKKKLLIIGILLLTNSLIAQQTPAKSQSKSVLVVGATAHIGDGNVIEKSFIGFENGIINLVDSEYNFFTEFDNYFFSFSVYNFFRKVFCFIIFKV